MTLRPVTDRAAAREFLDFARRHYRDDPNWVCPLDMEINRAFDPKHNVQFQHGEAARWLVTDDDGRTVGRIAAFINYKKAPLHEQPTGGLGFFECVNDAATAALLFDTARDWLAARGMEAMDGPINFGENDRNWGLLVEGFTQPFYGSLYNPPYYRDLFEGYGFTPYFEQLSKHMDLTLPKPEKYAKIAAWLQRKGHIRFAYAERDKLEKYAEDFRIIYNEAWQHHPQFTPLTAAQMIQMISELRMVIVEELCVFAYVNDEPAGFVVSLPDLNQIFKPFNGRMTWLDTLLFLWRRRNRFAWYRRRGQLNRARAMIMGVRPKFQKLGLEAGMPMSAYDDLVRLGFHTFELGWVGDFNPNMRDLLEATGAADGKRFLTYRYLFRGQGERQTAGVIARDHRHPK